MNKVLREEKKPGPLSAVLLEIAPEEEFIDIKTGPRKFITPPLDLNEIIK